MAGARADWQRFGLQAQSATAVLVAGLLFSVCARLHLGTNWSASVTLKETMKRPHGAVWKLVRPDLYGLPDRARRRVLIGGEWRGAIGVLLVFASLAWCASRKAG